jgi:hypothetical protein
MQVQFALETELRRDEFVHRALHFPPVLTLDVEPHQLSPQAREALAQCHPELPDVFPLLAARSEIGIENAKLWEITVNPNAYAAAEVVEMWARDFNATRTDGAEGAAVDNEDWAANVFDF